MKQRIYIDTSVFGGHFDEEFKEYTVPLFERIKSGEFLLLYSAVTQDELENAPEKVKELVKRSCISFFYVISRMINKMHIINSRRASSHTRVA